MSKVQNLPVNLKIVDAFLETQGASDVEAALNAGRALVAELKAQRQALNDGYTRKELTVCTGKLGYMAPDDVQRILRGEIPRGNVYKKKKDNHHMPVYFKTGPGFYKANPPAPRTAKPAKKAVRK